MVFPITATVPSYMVIVRSKTRQSNIYYQNETGRAIDLLAWSANGNAQAASQAFTGTYSIRNYYGTQVATGALTAATSVPVPNGLPCGGYRIHLTQSVNDATYGLSGGAGNFIVVNADAHFPSIAGVTPTNSGTHARLGDDWFMHGITLMGPRRDLVADPANATYQTFIANSLTADASWYRAIPDTARPRPAFTLNVDPITGKEAAWRGIVADAYDRGMQWFEGPANEPTGNAATIAGLLQTFSAETKTARAGAKVLGPCPVTFNAANNVRGTGYLHNVLANLAAMNPLPIDGISVHGYNCLNGDLSLGRKAYQSLLDTIADVGLTGLPIWHTEQGYWAEEHGALMPRLQGRWTMLMFLLQEQYGIPKEQHSIFYDTDTGDYNFPSAYATGDTCYFPVTAMMRAYSAEIWGKTYTSMLDFGTPGNDMLLGNVYSGSGGTKTIALQSAGSTDLTVNLSVSGAGTLTVVDCFGNTSTVPVTGGTATVPVALEPVYVRLPAGVTATVAHEWNATALGTDLAATSTASASGASGATQAQRMVDGNQISTYYLNSQLVSRTQTNAPYIDDTNAFPAWAKFTWATPQTLDRVVVFAAPPWQAQGTLLDFDVQWLDTDGTTWRTVQTITEKAQYGAATDAAANVLGHVTHAIQGGSTVETFFSDRWVFPVKFPSKVTTSAIRVFVRNATYGMDATIEAQAAKGAADTTSFGNNFTIRSVQAFNSTAPPNPYVVRNIT